MNRLVMIPAVLLLSLLVIDSGGAPAISGVPDPALSTVPNVIYAPGGGMEYMVTVVSAEGPVDSALVQLVFSTEADAMVCWCVGQVHPIIEAVSDAAGEARFYIAAGGCIDPAFVDPAIEVYANGVKLADVGAVSPDGWDNSGVAPWEGWNPAGTCGVGIADAVTHTTPIALCEYDFCTDFNSDGLTTLLDAIYLTEGIMQAWFCTQD